MLVRHITVHKQLKLLAR